MTMERDSDSLNEPCSMTAWLILPEPSDPSAFSGSQASTSGFVPITTLDCITKTAVSIIIIITTVIIIGMHTLRHI